MTKVRNISLCLFIVLASIFRVESFTPLKHFKGRSVVPRQRITLQAQTPNRDRKGGAVAALFVFAAQLFLGPPSLHPIEIFHPAPAWADVSSKTNHADPLVEEGWGLLSKFYLDKTFNGQDWDAAHVAANTKAANKGGFKALNEMTQSLGDKYTRIVDKDTYTKLSRFDLIGAGVLFSPDDAGKLSVSSPPMSGSSGLSAGLHKGDLVLAINGVPTEGMTSFDVIDLVTASGASSKLDLKLQDVGTENVRTVSLDRQVASIADPVSFRLLDGTSTGYIRLAEFNSRSTNRVKEAVVDLGKQGATRLILDLRGNGGGTFQTAVSIAGLFMSDRPVTTVVDGSGGKSEFRTDSSTSAKEAPTDVPLVLWVDRGSASASEVLTGALHDNCRALVAGDRTFGKGVIQGVFGLEDGSGLIITVARYQTPAGIDINKVGVQPDVSRELGINLLGGAVRVAQDMGEDEWALAQQRQGGKLCSADSTKQLLSVEAASTKGT